MWKILSDDIQRYITEIPDKGIKYLIKGAGGTGKTILLQERCIFLADSPGIPAASILVLLADNKQLEGWNSFVSEKASARLKCCTFSSFVKEELTVYYPLASAICGEILQKEIKPLFLESEASIHLISKVIQSRREKDGIFAALVSSNERIAGIVANNLKAAALEGIPAEGIGCRLYEAMDRKDEAKERILKDMDEIGLAYRKKCLELGVLDYSMVVEIFRKFLLQDEIYRQSLCKRFRHLIIDDLQETSYVMLELAELLLSSCDTAFLAYDPEFGSAELIRGNRKFIESMAFKACQIVELEKAGKSALGDALYSAILSNESEEIECGLEIEQRQQSSTSSGGGSPIEKAVSDETQSPAQDAWASRWLRHRPADVVHTPRASEARRYSLRELVPDSFRHKRLTKFERSPVVELRSEMLEQLAHKVCSLVNDDGFSPSDIVILSTYGDIVSELVISNILNKNGITLTKTGRRHNATDSPLCTGLLAFAKLCHPELRLFPEKGTVRKLIDLLFGLDPVRSSKIARKTCSTFPYPELPELEETIGYNDVTVSVKNKYDYVKTWISDYKGSQDKTVNISMFLQLSLMEIFLDGDTVEEEIIKAKQLVDIADRFCNATVKFGRNTSRDFIEMAENILKVDEGFFQFQEVKGGVSVVLTTPEDYITSPGCNKVMIISGLSSRHWFRSWERELSNPRVLSVSWESGMKFAKEMEEANSRQYLASMLRTVLEKGISRVIAFESLLSENGFENDGILPDIIKKICFTNTSAVATE